MKYKIRDIAPMSSKTVNPQLEPNTIWHLYSLPSYDEGQCREEVLGKLVLSNKFVVPKRCILYNKLNVRFKRVWRINCNEDHLIASTEFLPLVPNESLVDYNYLYYILVSDNLTNYLNNQNSNTSSSHKRIDVDLFLDMYIELPPLDIQQKIGKIIAINDKITLNTSLNAELEAMAKQLYDYWFVQFDFPDENGKPYKSSGGKMVWNEKLKREIPEGWEVKTVSDCIKHVNTGLNPRQNFTLGNGSIKYLTVKNLRTDGTIDYSNCDVIDEEARLKVHRRSDIQIKDILFASIAPLGRCHIILNEPTDWDINESVFSIRPRTDYISPYYLYIYFMGEWFVQKAEKDATGSIFAGIRINTLLEIPIVVPSKYISDMFDQCVCNIFKKKDDISIECNHLTHLRDSLLPMLMNGQVTIE